MNANHLGIPRAKASVRKYGTAWAIVLGCLLFAVTARAQNSFNSGSTGADGAFAPTTSQSIAVPTSGTFNFTTVNIPSGLTITFTRNSTNSPLTILASGDVVIAGNINIDGQTATANGAGALGGPGGSSGGARDDPCLVHRPVVPALRHHHRAVPGEPRAGVRPHRAGARAGRQRLR